MEEASDEEMEASSQTSSSNNNGLEDIISSEDETLEGKCEVPEQQHQPADNWHSCDDCANSPHSPKSL